MPSHCTPCDRTFKDAWALRDHLANSLWPHPRCGDCSKPFGSQESLDSHVGSGIHHNLVRTIPVVSTRRPSSTPVIPQQQNTVHYATLIASHGSAGSSSQRDSRWSIIRKSQHAAALDALAMHCHTPEELLKNRYVLDPNAEGPRKCKDCGGLETKIQRKTQNRGCTFHPGRRLGPSQGPKPGLFSCCLTRSKGCVSVPAHDYRTSRNAERYKTFKSTAASSISEPKCRAVVLDCEMVGVVGGTNEAASICVVDYLTGAVLLHKLVCPTGRVISWRSGIHGITKAAMRAAVANGEALAGWKRARQEVCKLIDDSTILVGHALHYDLDVLRIIHHRVVDSAILAQNAVGLTTRQWGLHTLCTELLHTEIRENDGELHDCLEDVLATREVALLCTRNKGRLQQWAEVAKADEERKVDERKAAQLRRQAKKEKVENQDATDLFSYSSSESERIRWSDVAEEFGWPHPDTGYDPWSD